MSELVERYVHQVGLFLPPGERAEIEAELRSQIADQLDDRFGGDPSQADVVAVLAERGAPHQVAVSYLSDAYLVGPSLYPVMRLTLRYGWTMVSSVVLFLNVFQALIAPDGLTVTSLVIQPLLAAVHATFIFSGVVVLLFAFIQHSGLEKQIRPFNPLELPAVNDPGAVDRLEGAFGFAIGIVVILAFGYFLLVGGLTLRFDLNNPGEVIPIPAFWNALLLVMVAGMIVMAGWVLWRNRWHVRTWLIETVLEVVGGFCLYFVLYRPVFERIVAVYPALGETPIIASLPEILVILNGLLILLGRGGRLLRLWDYDRQHFNR